MEEKEKKKSSSFFQFVNMKGPKKGVSVTKKKYSDGKILQFGAGSIIETGLKLQRQGGQKQMRDVIEEGAGGGMSITTPTTTSWGSILGYNYYQYHPLFTAAQWKELERQAMIYKYMVASLPVPPDLLFSIPDHLPSFAYAAPSSYTSSPWGKIGGIFNFSWGGNLKDGEPGRCKRTDGKKWRCSRDVAPNQKYCERHLHRGRPRSRKPVEVRADFPINLNTSKNGAAKKTRLGGAGVIEVREEGINNQGMGSKVQAMDRDDTTGDLCYKPIMPTTASYEKTRSFHWDMKGEQDNPMPATPGAQYWQRPLEQTDNMSTSTVVDRSLSISTPSFFQQNSGHDDASHFNLNSTAEFYPTNNNGETKNCPVSSVTNISPYSLALSTGDCSNDHGKTPEMCEIQMGPAVPLHSELQNGGDGPGLRPPQQSSWLNPGLSWVMPSAPTPGGPLAEVLRPHTVASNPSCSGDRDLSTPPASSPSGVLQRTLVSVSDSSGSNSPTWDGRKTNLEMPFHWLS